VNLSAPRPSSLGVLPARTTGAPHSDPETGLLVPRTGPPVAEELDPDSILSLEECQKLVSEALARGDFARARQLVDWGALRVEPW